jgi:hypothetical protein
VHASSGGATGVDASGFVSAFCGAEQRMLDAEAAATAAAAAAVSAAGTAAAAAAAAPQQQQQQQQPAAAPGPGSWDVDWRWRRRTSPLAVADRLRRMLLWRCAQAAARCGPVDTGAATLCAVVQPGEAAQGSVLTPVGCVRLAQLPREYLALFCQLLGLSMMPNAGVRASALPSMQSCLKRFPCLAELLLPEVLAALAGMPGLLVLPQLQPPPGGSDSGPSAGQQQQAVELPSAAAVAKFYSQTLPEAMQQQQAEGAAAPSAAAAGGQAAAATAAGAAAAAAAAAGGSSSSRSVAQESENDGRVAGACSVLASSLEAWRVVFRDPLAFRAFVAALLASRCHSSNLCLKSIQVIIMQVGAVWGLWVCGGASQGCPAARGCWCARDWLARSEC